MYKDSVLVPPDTRTGLNALIQRLKEKKAKVKSWPIRPREERSDAAPLSFSQKRLWLLDQLAPGSVVYNVAGGVRLAGSLNVAALRRAMDEMVRRHEVLRTTFELLDGEPIQRIGEACERPLPVVDLTGLAGEARAAEERRLSSIEARTSFDLARGRLLRATLLALGRREHLLLLTMHHVVADGWSLGVFLRELAALYGAFAAGEPSPLAPQTIQYADFAVWQRQRTADGALERHSSYWREQLAGIPVLELPADRPRSAAPRSAGARCPVRLSADTRRELEQQARYAGATLNMVLLAGFAAWLGRLTQQRDFGIGSPIANRTRREIEGLVGFFANTLVLRMDLTGDPDFQTVLSRVKDVSLAADQHQDMPFEQLVEEMQLARQLSTTPLFQVMFSFDASPLPETRIGDLALEPVEIETGTSKFDLSLFLATADDGLAGHLEVDRDLFDASTLRRLTDQLETFLVAAATEPLRPVKALPLLPPTARHQLLREWNDTRAPASAEAWLHELFEERARRNPDAAALIWERPGLPEQVLSYGALDARANRWARRLRELGVGPEVAVAICVERSPEMVVSLLAVLKAGGVYVPIDPEYPRDRVAFILEDAGAAVLLTQEWILDRLPAAAPRVVCLDRDQPAPGEALDPEAPGASDRLAYVIYTSGSTGRPKGVMVSHRSIVSQLRWLRRAYSLGPGDRLLQKTSLSFDASVWEVFAPLLSGASLVLARPGWQLDVEHWVETLVEHRVSALQLVPSLLQVLVDQPGLEDCRALRRVFSGGESLSEELVERLRETSRAEIVNLYGPTETTVQATAFRADVRRAGRRPGSRAGGSVPIGRAVDNTQVHLLDRQGELVGASGVGEVVVGGSQVARGYRGRPGRTAESFVPDEVGGRPGARLYRTGDLARRLPAGEMVFVSRLDHQVKLRGFRIELGEIESVLRRHDAIREVAVLAREDSPGDRQLVAYVVASSSPTDRELRAFARESLPDYMVPAVFFHLSELPLSPNGKLDRRALPSPSESLRSRKAFVAPRSAVEEDLCALWQELLGVESISVHDDFFELGGHSLKAAQLSARVREEFLVELPVRAVFEAPTVAELTVAIARGLLSQADGDLAARAFAEIEERPQA